MERKKVFHLDGGAGRVICALPALEKYAKKNPDFNVIIGGWDVLTFGIVFFRIRHIVWTLKVYSIF